MEGDSSTETLRTLAPKWTLAGDDQLLNILQNTHERIITKCQEVNSKLSEMSSALDDAGISLQNVNNKFMALSNSQFIESRVYDDDEVTAENIPTKDLPSPKVESELSMLKRSIAVLESMHESVTILRDSDTETDSEDEEISRTVLKPKDLYASRPLPHIIGSQLWKNKWHAGLLPEDSDSDSTTSKRESRELDEYSESDQEIESNVQTDTLRLPDRTVSETSSEPASEQDILPPAPKKTPSDIAAELARRLGGQLPKVIESEPDISPSKPPERKVYKPEQPVTGRVFSDEPPPIDDYMSESSSDNGDIFAELHKKPHEVKKNVAMNPAEDLFGFDREDDYQRDIFKDFAKDEVTSNQGTTQKSSLFDNEPESSLFTEKRENEQQNIKRREENESGTIGVKKPVGGVSVFGNNKSEIGAAVLRRQRKSSSSSEVNLETIDEGGSPVSKNDIFDDLFDKSNRNEKGKNDNKSKLVEKVPKGVLDDIFERNKQKDAMIKVETSTKSNILTDQKDKSTKNTSVSEKQTQKTDSKLTEKPIVDLFNDDLFDDIDDIFTTNVVKIPKKDDKNQKSLFDDEDDLFADIATTTKENIKTDAEVDKGIFESDDDLFTDRLQIIGSNKATDIEVNPPIDAETKEVGSIASESKKIDRSIFDSDDEFFSEKFNVPNTSKTIINQKVPALIDNKTKEIASNASNEVNTTTNINQVIFDSDDELFNKMPNISFDSKSRQNIDKSKLTVRETKEVTSVVNSTTVNKINSDSDDELFTSKSGAFKANNSIDSNANQVSMQSKTKSSGLNVNKEISNKNIMNTKTSIFDSDSDSDIFSNKKVVPKINEEVSKSLRESKQILESNESSYSQTLIANATDKLSNMRSPSLFDDDDEELFTTKDKIRNLVMNKDETNKYLINQTPESDKMQDYIENTKIDNIENIDNESTQVKIAVKIGNDNNEITKLTIDNYKNVDESVIPIENTSNVPNETQATENVGSRTKDNLLQSDIKTNSTNTITSVEASSKIISNNDILDSNSKDTDNSIFNVKQIEKNPDFEGAEQFETNKLPAEIVPNNTKDGLNISKEKFIDQRPKATTTQIFEANKQNPDKFEQNTKSPTANTESNVFKDIFSQPLDFKSIDTQTRNIIEKPDVFSDIFTEPPIFEKPKEPKKSKNVNALFDDDSDDEALFFKKSDIVDDAADDVAHDFSPDVKKDNLFDIFHDEPPAIDVDFITKTGDTVTSKIHNNTSIFTASEDPIINYNNPSEVILGNKEINKDDITQSILEIPQELQKNDDSKDAKSELCTPTGDHIPKFGDKKSINIHDLFSKDDGLFKTIDISNSTSDQKSVESLGESSKILGGEKPDTDGLIETHVSKPNETSSIFGVQSDDDIFKSSQDDNKKKIIVQEDEIDNLFIAKNKIPSFDTDKSFDNIFKTSEQEILIKETKITHDTPNNNIYKEPDDTKSKEEIIKSTLVNDDNIAEYSDAEGSKSSENISKLKEISLIRNVDIIKSNSYLDTSGSSKIGKLKAKINIDVSKLLPGASPKKKIDKPKSPDQENSSPISIIPTPFSNKNTSSAKVDKETIKQEIFKSVSNDSNKSFVASPNNSEDKSKNSDQKSTKTISFDEQSAILDNTLSKERAKIQVKRRPSTRRARREAVRKSTIGNDSTDNSSSIDDQPKTLDDIHLGYENQEDLPSDTKNKENGEILQTEAQTAIQTKTVDNNINKKGNGESKIASDKVNDQEYFYRETDKTNENITSTIIDNKESSLTKELENDQENFHIQGDRSNRNVTTKIVDNKKSLLTTDKEIGEKVFHREVDKSNKNITSTTIDYKESILTTKKENDKEKFHSQGDKSNKNVTSKIVYVLNDEDIFNTKAETSVLEKEKFGSKFTESINPIATLGNVYKSKKNITENVHRNNNSKPKASLFGESSDEDKLFGKGKNRKTFSTKVLFDSDSDDDLFVGNKERKETKDDFRKRVPIVKGSLFGDDDDGDDLFGDKRKRSDKTLSSRPSTSRETNKPSEPVFQDPLSMLENEE